MSKPNQPKPTKATRLGIEGKKWYQNLSTGHFRHLNKWSVLFNRLIKTYLNLSRLCRADYEQKVFLLCIFSRCVCNQVTWQPLSRPTVVSRVRNVGQVRRWPGWCRGVGVGGSVRWAMLATQMVVEEGECVLQEEAVLNVLLFYFNAAWRVHGNEVVRISNYNRKKTTVPPGLSDSCPVLTSSKNCLCWCLGVKLKVEHVVVLINVLK